jgi:hypothetical protein
VGARESRLRGRALVAWVVGTAALVLALALALRPGFRSPCLVGAALPLGDTEILLLTGPVDKRATWQVYGMDGKPRRAWGNRPLPGGVIETSDGRLRRPGTVAEPVEQIEAGMSQLAPGQTRFVNFILGNHLVRFEEPAGILIERFGTLSSAPELLQRVRLDGSLVWSESLVALLGPIGFDANVTELRHAHVQTNGKSLVLVLQALASFSVRPVDAAVSRIVVVESISGRVLSRSNVSPPS